MRKKRSAIPKGYKLTRKGRGKGPFWMAWFDHAKKRVTIYKYPDARTRNREAARYPGSVTIDDPSSPIVQKREAARKRAKLKETRVDLDVDPASLARAAGVTPRTAKRWMREGGAPRTARDAALSLAMGQEPYTEPRSGKAQRISEERLSAARKTMTAFVEAVREGQDEKKIKRRYSAWRKEKDRIRSRVSRRAWQDFIEEMGEELDLPDIGVFSKEHFRKS